MYHVNPKTGEFGICHAKSPESCPFGCENHSESYDEIQIKADKINKILKSKKTKISLTEFKSMLESDSPEISNIEVIFTERDSIKEIECKNKVFTNVHFPNIHNSILTKCEFNNCNFTSDDENYRNLYENTMFINCKIENSNLSNIEFIGGRFHNIDISNSNFDNSRISSTLFKNVAFNDSSFKGMKFEEYCSLEEVDFNNCNAEGIIFFKNSLSDCKISNSNFNDMYYKGGNDDKISNCKFNGEFKNAIFEDIDLVNSEFKCNMKFLTIENSFIQNTVFNESDLTNMNFNRVDIEYSTFDKSIKNGNFKNCKLNNVSLKDSSFSFDNSTLTN